MRPAFIVCAFVVLPSCTRDRAADPPPVELALAAPVADGGPTIRPPQRGDVLEVPSAAPPTASVAPTGDEIDEIEVAECRDLMRMIQRCLPADTFRDVLRNFKQSTREPSVRDNMAEMCRRVTDAYAQNTGMCNGGP